MVFSVLLIILFFQQRSSLPRLISISLGIAFLVQVADYYIADMLQLPLTITDGKSNYQEILKSFFVAAIWIPYFNISERVKETFVFQKQPQEVDLAEVE